MSSFPLSFADPSLDLSFAICPRRHRELKGRYQTGDWCTKYTRKTSFDPQKDCSLNGEGLESSRSVSFATRIVSEIICVPRYDKEHVRDLFYSPMDFARFKIDYRKERMQ
mmetsp:Transcript_397/g.876  ORF Transcript_397/g.876 Transcript_397/m.876 type:complete len:110 (+) Transcript_397:128-457(+)